MLFDLRGRGRRRTVKIVYLALALLMGGGLVLFGIGGATQRRPRRRDHRQRRRRHEHRHGSYKKRLKALEQRPRRPTRSDAAPGPRSPAPRFQRAGVGDNFDPTTGAYTAKGKRAAARRRPRRGTATSRSTRNKPDDRVAGLMVQAFGPAGLEPDPRGRRRRRRSSPTRAADAATLFAQLADARLPGRPDPQGRPRRATRRVELAPKEQRKTLKAQLDQAKQQAHGAADQHAATHQRRRRRRRPPSAVAATIRRAAPL